MIWIAVDVTHLAIAQMDADATAAGAHVTGGIADFDLRIGERRGERIMKWRR